MPVQLLKFYSGAFQTTWIKTQDFIRSPLKKTLILEYSTEQYQKRSCHYISSFIIFNPWVTGWSYQNLSFRRLDTDIQPTLNKKENGRQKFLLFCGIEWCHQFSEKFKFLVLTTSFWKKENYITEQFKQFRYYFLHLKKKKPTPVLQSLRSPENVAVENCKTK